MSDYTQITDFSAKDSLATGDSEKKILGSDVDAELSAISTAIGTKANQVGSPTANNVLAMDSNGDLTDAGFAKTPGTGLQIASSTLELDIDGLTAETTIDSANDTIPVYDNSATAIRKFTVDNIIPDATTSVKGKVELATQAEMESETASKIPTADIVKHNPGVAKGWVQVSVSSGTPSIDVNLNVGSITDNGVGDFTVNWTTAFSTANYAIAGWGRDTDTQGDAIVGAATADSKTSSAVQIKTVNAGATAIDAPEWCIIAMGDQ